MEALKDYVAEATEPMLSEETVENEEKAQTDQERVRVRIDETNLQMSYVSGFRPTMTAEELVLDIGVNQLRSSDDKEQPHELVFQASNRLVMNYYSAKRMAISLAQIVRQFEQRFGQIELNAVKRRQDLQK